MYRINNFINNDNIKITSKLGAFVVLEHKQDLSVMPETALVAYYAEKMNVKKRQVLCNLKKSPVTVQSGAMQWSVGDVSATTGIKNVGNLISKGIRGSVTGESAIKPEYIGKGSLILEPTYKYILLENLANWNGSMVIDDGLVNVYRGSGKILLAPVKGGVDYARRSNI